METQFTPLASLFGGAMIGASAVWLMAATGRIAGISGILSRLLPPFGGGVPLSTAFVFGLLLAVPIYIMINGSAPVQAVSSNLSLLIPAGLLVGFGTVLGNGCTSGHGVCGLSRLSPRSLVATVTFMLFAFATVLVMRHGLGG